MRRIEALATGIASQYDALNPGSEAFATLNPGMLHGHSLSHMNVVNENGKRVFASFQAGYRALIANIEMKCAGKTQALGRGVLGPSSSLNDLVRTFPNIRIRLLVEHLKDALEDNAISESTPLAFFLEGTHGN